MSELTELTELIGKTFNKVVIDKENQSNDAILFLSESSQSYILTHIQDCCEHVTIESIDGTSDIQETLAGQKILQAYESYNYDAEPRLNDSATWSFYIIRTMLDTYTIRFYGESNGYYSESAELREFKPRE